MITLVLVFGRVRQSSAKFGRSLGCIFERRIREALGILSRQCNTAAVSLQPAGNTPIIINDLAEFLWLLWGTDGPRFRFFLLHIRSCRGHLIGCDIFRTAFNRPQQSIPVPRFHQLKKKAQPASPALDACSRRFDRSFLTPPSTSLTAASIETSYPLRYVDCSAEYWRRAC